MNDRPTPETDARFRQAGMVKSSLADFARKLERERDEAREALSGRTVSCSQCNEAAKQMESLHDAIRDTHAVLDADESRIIRNARGGYPEGREPRELTLAERVEALCTYAADWKRWCEDAEKMNDAMRDTIKEAHAAINLQLP